MTALHIYMYFFIYIHVLFPSNSLVHVHTRTFFKMSNGAQKRNEALLLGRLSPVPAGTNVMTVLEPCIEECARQCMEQHSCDYFQFCEAESGQNVCELLRWGRSVSRSFTQVRPGCVYYNSSFENNGNVQSELAVNGSATAATL